VMRSDFGKIHRGGLWRGGIDNASAVITIREK